MKRAPYLSRFLNDQARARQGALTLAAIAALGAGLAAPLLLGVSGWFLGGAALAGLGGYAVVHAFNYLLPSAALRGLAILRSLTRYGERLASHDAALGALAELRPSLFAALAASPPAVSLGLSSGEASARMIQDVNAVETAFARRGAPWMAGATLLTAIAVVSLASLSAASALLFGAGLQLALAPALAQRAVRAPARDQLQAAARLKAALSAYLPAAAELRVFSLSAEALGALEAQDRALLGAGVRRQDLEAGVEALRALISAATLVAVARLAAHAALPLEALALLAAAAGLEGPALILIAGSERAALDGAVDRLEKVLEAPALTQQTEPPPPPDAPLRLDGRTLYPGERVIITGPSGSGKSTLLEMWLGLREATPGRLRIGERPLETAPTGWARPLFAWRPQDARLTTGSLGQAMRLSNPEAKDSEIHNLIAALGLEQRFAGSGLDAWIGDGGEILSGGERGRLALLRALLSPAPWLLLDEPTEGLDSDTEAQVVRVLERHLGETGRGLILISHRLGPR